MAYIGKTPSQAVRSRYFYTATGGETSLSGADDNGDTLIFADGNYVDVYLNGVLLVASSDYNVNTVNTIAGLTALTASDIVEIVVYDTFSVFGGTFQGTLTANQFVGPLTGNVTGELNGAINFIVKNLSGGTITKGTPVYISGHSGNTPEVNVADADDPAKMPAIGVATEDFNNNTQGNIVTFGDLIGFNTAAFSVNDELYVSTTGTLTATRPNASNTEVQKIAKVVRSHSTNGQLFIMGAGRSNDVPNAITTNSINLSSTTTVDSVLDEDTMTSDSATALATQQSIKAYVDSQIGSNNELSEILTNGNTTGGNDISFADNDKAVFGAGSDLQIYHGGSASDIKETGTGNLRIWGDDIQFFNSAGSKYHAQMITDGAITLYYNGAEKLATTATGVNVTGTVTASSVGVGAAPNATFGSLLYTQGAPAVNKPIVSAYSQGNSNNAGFALFNDVGNRGIWTTGSTMRFTRTYEGNSTADLTIDASGNVGIGGSETTVFNGAGGEMRLVVLGNDSTSAITNNTNSAIAIVNTNHTAGNLAGLHFARADTDYSPNYAGASIVAQFPDAQVTGQYPRGDLAFLTSTATNSAPSEKMRLTADGRVGIGTYVPATTLETRTTTSGLPATSGTTPANVALRLSSTATTGIIDMGLNGANPWIQSTDRTNLGVPYNLLLNPNGGNVGIGNNNPSQKLSVAGTIESKSSSTAFYATVAGNYNQQNGASGTAWAYGSVGGTAAPGTASTTFGMHHWNGNSWKNPLNIDTSGNVTMPYQPAFSVYHTLHASSNSYIVHNSVLLNNGNHYNSTNGRFTAPVAGNYMFYATGLVQPTGGTSRMRLYKNQVASPIAAAESRHQGGTAGAYLFATIQAVVTMSAGDYIQQYYINDDGATTLYSDGTPYISFGGHLIG